MRFSGRATSCLGTEVTAAVAGPLRRLAAAGYDGLLLLAVLMLLTAALQLATHGEAITTARVGSWAYGYRALLAAIVLGYFGLGWTRGGRTLGMQAWGLRLETANGASPGWRAAARRLAVSAPAHLAALGGALSVFAHRAGWGVALASAAWLLALHASGAATQGRTLIDWLSATRVVRLDPRR